MKEQKEKENRNVKEPLPVAAFVLAIDGSPLMPIRKYGKVRHLLKEGLAEVVCREPFTIRLTYETKRYVQKISLGIDPGHSKVGLSATTEKEVLFENEFTLDGGVKERIATKREYRSGRRHRKTRYREPRFQNRKKPEGWLAPSIEQKLGSHMAMVELICEILPIAEIHVEVAPFDTQLLMAEAEGRPAPEGKDYQHGPKEKRCNEREYVLYRDGHKCRNCGGKSGDHILQTHHIVSRKIGGDSPSNLVTLCKTCHQGYHDGTIKLRDDIKPGKSLAPAAFMNAIGWKLCESLREKYGKEKVIVTYGYRTKMLRKEYGLEKTHCNDARAISGNPGAVPVQGCSFKSRKIANHTRSLHVAKPAEGGKRRSKIAPHKIGNSRFQRFDMVEWNGIKCFIYGSTTEGPN